MDYLTSWWQSSRLQEYLPNLISVLVFVVLAKYVFSYVYGQYLNKWVQSIEKDMDQLKRRNASVVRQKIENHKRDSMSLQYNSFQTQPTKKMHRKCAEKTERKVFEWKSEDSIVKTGSERVTRKPETSRIQQISMPILQSKISDKKAEIVKVVMDNPYMPKVGLRDLAVWQQQNIIKEQIHMKKQEEKRIQQQKLRQIAEEKDKKAREEAQRLRLQTEKKAAALEKERKLKQQQQQEAQKLQQQKQAEAQIKKQQDEALRKQKQVEEQKRKQKEIQDQKDREVEAQRAESQRKLIESQKRMQIAIKAPNEQILETYVKYAQTIHERKPIGSFMNSIGDVKKNVKDIFILTDSLLESFAPQDQEEQDTFAVKMWQMIVAIQFKAAKKEGFEELPPTSEEVEIYKNMVNGFALMVNLMRVRGQERLWLYMVGKTLSLVDFIYKRKEPLKSYKDLELMSKGYLSFTSNIEKTYTSRLDQITYFLFALLAMDPYTCFSEIIERIGQPDLQTMGKLQEIKIPWDYSPFWILVSCIRRTSFKYFKPICYSNILSMLYFHYRQALKTNTVKKNPFAIAYQQMIKQSQEFGKLVDQDPEILMLLDTDEPDQFNGDDFFDTIEPMAKNLYRSKKRILDIRNYRDYEKEASPLYYFKPFELDSA